MIMPTQLPIASPPSVQIRESDEDRFICLGVELSSLTDVRGAGPIPQVNIQSIIAVCFNRADDATPKQHTAILMLDVGTAMYRSDISRSHMRLLDWLR